LFQLNIHEDQIQSRSMKFKYLIIVLLLAACSTTEIVNSWQAPDAEIDKDKLNKVLVAVLAESDATRRASEDRMAGFHPSFKQSYTLFPNPETTADELKCQSLLEKEGVDGIIVVRMLKVGEEQTFIPSNPGVPYWGGWHGRYWGAYNQPGYYRTDLMYTIETNVFSLRSDKLLWTGLSTTMNPGRFDRAIQEVIEASYKKMKSDGLFVEK
jgi:hypothetical protein